MGLGIAFVSMLVCICPYVCVWKEKRRGLCLFSPHYIWWLENSNRHWVKDNGSVNHQNMWDHRWSDFLRRKEVEHKLSSIHLPARMVRRRVSEGGVGTHTQLNILYSWSQPNLSLLTDLAWLFSVLPVFLISHCYLMGMAACGVFSKEIWALLLE